MPVYEHTYRTWTGERRGPIFRWMAIPKFAAMDFIRQPFVIWVFSVAWLQFFLRLAYMYLLVNAEFLKALNIPQQTLFPIDAFFFKNLIDIQLPFCFMLAFLIGSGLVSRDLKHSALVLYVSKPISRWEYFFGKFSILFFIFLALTLFQMALLFIIQVAISPSHSAWRVYFWHDYAWILGAGTLYSLIIAITLSLLILAASSLTKNGRYAGITFAVYIIGTGIVAGTLQQLLNQDGWWALSPFHAGVDLGYYLFRIESGRRVVSQPWAWASILGNWAFCGLILRWTLERAARFGR